MGFLDNTGLTYYTNKLKSIFVRSVNGQVPIGDQGNVEITQVPLADNLYNDEIKDSPADFIYRISGGLNDIESGDAGLVSISGNCKITGRQEERVTIESPTGINFSCNDIISFRNKIGSTQGTYTFQYVPAPFPNENIENQWASYGTWQYNNNTIQLSEYGLAATGIINKSIIITTTGTGITQITINPTTFLAQAGAGSYTFTCVTDQDEEGGTTTYKWQLNGEDIALSNYGIIVTGSYTDRDLIVVVCNIGTPASNCSVTYYPYINGTYIFSTPQLFSSTGFNQFNKNSDDFYITNAIINSNKVIENGIGYVCYCKAAYGSPAGYLAYSENGYITGIGWCKNIPTIGTELSGTETTFDTEMGFPDGNTHRAIMFEEDGYVVVSVTNISDLCIHLRWDTEEDDVFEDYVDPSIIDFQNLKGTYNNVESTLPISSYGMPAINYQNEKIGDILDLRNKIYIQNIERLENTPSNMADVIAAGVTYEYTAEYIYYILNEPKIYSNVVTLVENEEYEPISYSYIVNDLATEEFVGTEVTVSAVQRYGENLRNKLKGNVLTISKAEFTNEQIASIRANFLDIIYPIGSIYISMNSTSPELLWGGVWQKIEDRFLIGQSGTYAAGSTGGETMHVLTIDEMPEHTHSQGSHSHKLDNGQKWSGGSGSTTAYTQQSNRKLVDKYTGEVVPPDTNPTGGGLAHNNMPPYLAVYMWQRIM